MTGFEGKTVFITGASSGIGAALAREFGRAGANLVLAARRVDRLERLAGELRETGRRVVVAVCDARAAGDLERAVASAREQLGRIDVAVANAGFGVVGAFEELTLDDYLRQFETNVFGVLRTVYAVIDDIKKTRGVLVLMGSVSGHVALPGTSPYAMSKFAVRALAESLASELRPHGVAVVLISPGFVDSEIRQVDNHGVWRGPVPDPIPAWLRMSTARAARQIVRAVAARRHERIITGHGKLIVLLQRHLPGVLRWGVERFGIRPTWGGVAVPSPWRPDDGSQQQSRRAGRLGSYSPGAQWKRHVS